MGAGRAVVASRRRRHDRYPALANWIDSEETSCTTILSLVSGELTLIKYYRSSLFRWSVWRFDATRDRRRGQSFVSKGLRELSVGLKRLVAREAWSVRYRGNAMEF